MNSLNLDEINPEFETSISSDPLKSFPVNVEKAGNGIVEDEKNGVNMISANLQGEEERKEHRKEQVSISSLPAAAVEEENCGDGQFDSMSKSSMRGKINTTTEGINEVTKSIKMCKQGNEESEIEEVKKISESSTRKNNLNNDNNNNNNNTNSNKIEDVIINQLNNQSGVEKTLQDSSGSNQKEKMSISLTNENINKATNSSSLESSAGSMFTSKSTSAQNANNNSSSSTTQKAEAKDDKSIVRSQSVVTPPTCPVPPSLVAAASATNLTYDSYLIDPNYIPITDEPGELLQLQKKSHGVKRKENKQGIKYESRIRYQYGETSADSSIAYLGNYQCAITAARTYDMAKVVMKGLYVVREKAARSLNFEYDFLVKKGNKGRILYMRTKPLQPGVTPVKIYRVASSINWLHGRDNHIWRLKEKEENHSLLYQYCDVIPWNNVEEVLAELGQGNSTDSASNKDVKMSSTANTNSKKSSSTDSGQGSEKKIKETDGNLSNAVSSASAPSSENIDSDDFSKLGQQLGFGFDEEEEGLVGVDSTGKNVQRKKLERLNNRKKKVFPSFDIMTAEGGAKIDGLKKIEQKCNKMQTEDNAVKQKNKKGSKRKAGEAMAQNQPFLDGDIAGHPSTTFNSTDYGDDHLSFDEVLKATNFKNQSDIGVNKEDSSDNKGKKKRSKKNPAADTSFHGSQMDYSGKYNFGAACFSLPTLDTSAYNLDINFTNNPFQGCSPYQSNLMLVTNALATVASGQNLHGEGSSNEETLAHSDHNMMNISLRDFVVGSGAESSQMKFFQGEGGAESCSETTNTKSEVAHQRRKPQVEEQNDALAALYGDSISAYDYL